LWEAVAKIVINIINLLQDIFQQAELIAGNTYWVDGRKMGETKTEMLDWSDH